MNVHLVGTKPLINASGQATDDKVTFPRLAYAFNPIAVKVQTEEEKSVRLIVGEGENRIEIVRETFARDGENNVFFDLSAIARSLFDQTQFHKFIEPEKSHYSEDEYLYKEMKCQIVADTGSYSFNIPVIWGAMQIGETYSQNRTFKMFVGYPFTVSLFFLNLKSDSTEKLTVPLNFKIDDENWHNMPLDSGKHSFYLTEFLEKENQRFTLWLDNSKNDGLVSTFDQTFDYTFRGLSDNSFVVYIDSMKACDDDGYYLRWINSHGEYCYWMFKPQVESTIVENKSIEFDQYYTTVNYTNGYHVGTSKTVGKKVRKTVQLFADFVDSADYDFLKGLTQSPVVDLYMGNVGEQDRWMSVNIQPATFPKSKEHLQDFSFILELPSTQIQSL